VEKLIKFKLNEEEIETRVIPNKTLINMLREDFDLTGAKEGCGAGECGACTVLVDGKAVNSCLMLAIEAEGKEILTIEGLSDGVDLHPLQRAFVDHAALQCGYCTPGMIMTALAFLKKHKNPTTDEIKDGLAGNLCRCTGYQNIIDAVVEVSRASNK
jgi:aerobic-type carbon monoxide dehydrogenase small subunit (CoxS/CutS family)